MARLSYDAMRNLILDNMSSLRDTAVFTPELLTSIFWEETEFQNIPQKDGGPAVGFGQVERPTIKAVNGFFKTHFTPEQILADDNVAVQITSYTLAKFFRGLSTKMGALNGYAGTFSNPANKPIPARWVECERRLLAVHAADRAQGGTITQRSTYAADAEAIKVALKGVKPNSNPDVAFPSASP